MRKRAMSIGIGLAGLALGVGAWLLGPATESGKLLAPQAGASGADPAEVSGKGEAGAPRILEHARTDLLAPGSRRPGSGGASLEQVGEEDQTSPDAAGGSDVEGVGSHTDPRSVWTANKRGIDGAVKETFPELLGCYQGWLAENPDLAGNVTIQFVISAVDTGGMGGVSEVGIGDSDLGHEFMEGCVANVMSGLQFDAPDEPLTVNYPFEFSTADEDGE